MANPWIDLAYGAADHELNQPIFGSGLGIHRGDYMAVAQHRHASADAADLGHAMGDVNDADSLGGGGVDECEQMLGFTLRERSGRLVQDQHRWLGAEGLGDLHHLPLRPCQVLHRLSWIQRKAQAREQRPGLAANGLAIQKSKLPRLGAEVDVFFDGELRDQGEFLEHRADSQPARTVHRAQLDRDTPNQDLAGSRFLSAGQKRDQSGLAGAILAEKNVDFPGVKLKIDPVQGEHTGVLLDHLPALDQRRRRIRRDGPGLPGWGRVGGGGHELRHPRPGAVVVCRQARGSGRACARSTQVDPFAWLSRP